MVKCSYHTTHTKEGCLMATILPENQINQELNSSVHQFFRNQKLGTLLNQSNIRKEAGISPVMLVQFIFSLVLQKKNLLKSIIA